MSTNTLDQTQDSSGYDYESGVSFAERNGYSVRNVPMPKKAFGMSLRNGKLERICKLIVKGLSNRHVSKITGVSRVTVLKARRAMVASGHEAKCPCGKKGNHLGWCWRRMEIALDRMKRTGAVLPVYRLQL